MNNKNKIHLLTTNQNLVLNNIVLGLLDLPYTKYFNIALNH